MGELRACPFCGNAPSLLEANDHSTAYSVECLADDCPANPDVWELDKATAIAAWNARAPDWQSIAQDLARGLANYYGWVEMGEPLDTPAALSALDRFRAAGGVL